MKKDYHGGFTLGEMLLVLAILGILSALVAPNLMAFRKSLRQMELDAKAETLYIAAQNRMTKLRSSGQSDLYAADKSSGVISAPCDQEPQRDETGQFKMDENEEFVFTPIYHTAKEHTVKGHTVKGDPAADAILTDEVADPGLVSQEWVLEYDLLGNVYAVFYSEDRTNLVYDYDSNWIRYDKLRSKSARLDDGAEVGYYGGNFSASSANTGTISLGLSASNAEKLTVTMWGTAGRSNAQLKFKLTLEDEHGNKVTETYSTDATRESGLYLIPSGGGLYYNRTVVLDDLSIDALSNKKRRFTNLYGLDSAHYREEGKHLVPGDTLKITLSVTSPDRTIQRGADQTIYVNSLFGNEDLCWDEENDVLTAEIKYGRHLQNLDASSGLDTATQAVQAKEISFEKGSPWYSAYCPDNNTEQNYFNDTILQTEAKFKPIVNENLLSYTGSDQIIRGLRTSGKNAGLFGEINSDTELNNITLVNAYALGSDTGNAASALVGNVTTGKVNINRCRVYLAKDNAKSPAASDPDLNPAPWIDGDTTGGLIGTINGGTVTIRDSFASTVINGTDKAGGLVGNIASAGKLDIDTSYADSYLYGANTGGLTAGGTVNSITDCYAAGYQESTKTAAGLANGTVKSLVRAYTVSNMTCERDGEIYTTAKAADTLNSVYYFPHNLAQDPLEHSESIENWKGEELLEKLKGEETTNKFRKMDSNTTIAYNLRDQGLSSYPYPGLIINNHYGDWQAEFQSGKLWYYEVYKNENGTQTYGFEGPTLRNDGIVIGDGYGLVYKKNDNAIPEDTKIKFKLDGKEYENSGEKYEFEDDNGEVYVIKALPRELVNKDPEKGEKKLYWKLDISLDGGETFAQTYFFNPHLALTVKDAEPDLSTDTASTFGVRTPRHLYALSRYYDQYFRVDEPLTFQQGRDLQYSKYDWEHFYILKEDEKTVNHQEPIGRDIDTAFKDTYKGNTFLIQDVSFISKDGSYIGLFGYNTGTIESAAVVTEYRIDTPEKQYPHYYVQRTDDLKMNDEIYAGVLAGFNNGEISNCAIAGYYVAGSDGTLHARANSFLYAGGLVGGNKGTIKYSAADCPAIRLSSLDSNVDMGGFMGVNLSSGTVENCYALGHVEVAESRGGRVRAAGFAGRNDGAITQSYCGVSIITNGDTATSYGFSPKGTGQVRSCQYLDEGSYKYAGVLRSYNSVKDRTEGQSITYADLCKRQTNQTKPDSDHSICHPNVSEKESIYPFPAVINDSEKHPVHFGDWQERPALGTLGVFYWEQETSGSNNGYHFTYIGTSEGQPEGDTTLCNAHDDGGVIVRYGYGYYVQKGDESRVSLKSEGIRCGDKNNYFSDAKKDLENQMPQYTFYPFVTEFNEMQQYYVWLSDPTGKRDGTWTLTYKNDEGIDIEYRYIISPFFANAMCFEDATESIKVTGLDFRNTYYNEVPGTENDVYNNDYEVRCVQQFQYINWNNKTHNCSTLVYGEIGKENEGNRWDFPYLQYATFSNIGKEVRSEVEKYRPKQYWIQSHDIKSVNSSEVLTPIAGMATSTPVTNSAYTNILYAWFGGSYDGQNYKIQNVSVKSEAYTVGLFGATAGADINNIILYANDGTSVIERNTEGKTEVKVSGKTLNFEEGPGAYNLGGLIGIAYKYESEAAGTISNCSVAGYQVIDRSTNQQGAGTANVGGLIGLTKTNLENCSSTADIYIDCTHDHGHMYWGSYIRVGGLAGSSQFMTKNCYTGGSVKISDRTLDELPTKMDSDGFYYRDQGGGCSSNIFVSGIIGSQYGPNISNFTGNTSNAPDGKCTIQNCYTYLQLPNLEGTVRAVSLIASQADRYKRDSRFTITNCYYLEDIRDNIGHPDRMKPETWPKYYFVASRNLSDLNGRLPTEKEWDLMINEKNIDLIQAFNKRVISEEEFQHMLDGDLSCLGKYLSDQGPQVFKWKPDKATSVTFTDLSVKVSDQENRDMAARLNNGQSDSPWGWVSITEGANNSPIDGKYSFSSDPAQAGKNYPFPTILTQKDLTYSTATQTDLVNVHYGSWPSDEYYWENGQDTMDLFGDMDIDGGGDDGPYAEKSFKLYCKGSDDAAVDIKEITVAPSTIAESVESLKKAAGKEYYEVKIRALRTGSAVVTAKMTDDKEASFVLTITANLTLESSLQSPLTLYHENPTEITFSALATSALGEESEEQSRDYFTNTVHGKWNLKTLEDAEKNAFDLGQDTKYPNLWTITSLDEGTRTLTASYTYEYNEIEYSESIFFTVKSLGGVGLVSNGKYSWAYRRGGGVVTGSNSERLVDLPSGSELILFGTAVDGDLEDFTIQQITVTPKSGDEQVVYENGASAEGVDYSVAFGTFEEDEEPKLLCVNDSYGKFRYCLGEVRYTGGGRAPAEVTVTVLLSKLTGETGEDGPLWEAAYTLSVRVSPVKKYSVYFEPNGGVGSMADGMAVEDKYELPECNFIRPGYAFAGWTMEPKADEIGDSFVQPGGTIELYTDLTLIAQWTANSYTVHFESNPPDENVVVEGNMEDETFLYDTAQALPLCVYTAEGYAFDGWNTDPEGNGDKYTDGEDVSNLTQTDGGTVTLYAHWVKQELPQENTPAEQETGQEQTEQEQEENQEQEQEENQEPEQNPEPEQVNAS